MSRQEAGFKRKEGLLNLQQSLAYHLMKISNYLYLRFLAASDFFLRLTLGFS